GQCFLVLDRRLEARATGGSGGLDRGRQGPHEQEGAERDGEASGGDGVGEAATGRRHDDPLAMQWPAHAMATGVVRQRIDGPGQDWYGAVQCSLGGSSVVVWPGPRPEPV